MSATTNLTCCDHGHAPDPMSATVPRADYQHDKGAWDAARTIFEPHITEVGHGAPSRAHHRALRGRFFVYLLFDGTGRPAYLGSTCNLSQRLREHRNGAKDLGRHEWRAADCRTLAAARDAQTLLLRTYMPYLNRRRAA